MREIPLSSVPDATKRSASSWLGGLWSMGVGQWYWQIFYYPCCYGFLKAWEHYSRRGKAIIGSLQERTKVCWLWRRTSSNLRRCWPGQWSYSFRPIPAVIQLWSASPRAVHVLSSPMWFCGSCVFSLFLLHMGAVPLSCLIFSAASLSLYILSWLSKPSTRTLKPRWLIITKSWLWFMCKVQSDSVGQFYV